LRLFCYQNYKLTSLILYLLLKFAFVLLLKLQKLKTDFIDGVPGFKVCFCFAIKITN
jgi:hypothetical protein